MRILLADDQSKVRFALRVLLERQRGVEVVGEATTAQELLSRAEGVCPDLVLLGWELPGMTGDRLLTALRTRCPKLSVIGLSGQPGIQGEVLAAGADEFVSKGKPPEHLLAAIARCCGEGVALPVGSQRITEGETR